MKTILLGSCAGIAFALLAGSANAQAKFEVRIGGDAYFEAGYISQDGDDGLRGTEFRNRFRLNIVPTAKADNGLEYGGRFRIRANNADRTVDADRAILFVGGSFGRLDLGTRNTYSDDMLANFMRPIDFHFLGIYDSALAWVSAGNATAATTKLAAMSFGYQPQSTSTTQLGPIGDVSTKAVYYSPRFAGFQFAASYTPNASSSHTDINRTKNNGNLVDVLEVTANYIGKFGDVDLKGEVSYLGGAYENSGSVSFNSLRGVQAGGQIGYAGFILGGGYMTYGKSGLAKSAAHQDNYSIWNVGLQYSNGPWMAGAGYTRGTDAGDVRFAGNREQDYYTVGASYTAAPGLRFGLEYSFIGTEVNDTNVTAANRKRDSNVVIARSILTF